MDSSGRWRRWLVPGLALAVLAGMTFGVERYVHHQLDESIQGEAERLAERQALHLEDFVGARLAALGQLRIDIEDGSVRPGDAAAFEPRARLIQGSLAGYQAINWIDADGVFRIVVPLEGNEVLIGRRAGSGSNRAMAALEQARESGEVALSRPKELRQGGLGVVAYMPVRLDGELVGYLNATFRLEVVKLALLRAGDQGAFLVRVSDGDELLFETGEGEELASHVTAASASAAVTDRRWTVSVRPTAAHHASVARIDTAGLLFTLATLPLFAAALWIAMRRTDERRAARRRLRLLERVVEEARDYVGICDVNGRMLYMNAFGREMTGLGEADVQALTLSDISRSFDGVELGEVWDALHTSKAWRGRGQLANFADGGSIPVDLVISAIHEGDEDAVVGYAALGRDRRERERLEAQLRQAQKMEAVGQLAGGVAHDFNNLMTAVLGHGELLAERFADDRAALDDLQPILTAASSAVSLTRRLLAFGGGSSGEKRRVDAAEVIQGLSPLLSVLLRDDVDLRVELEPDLPKIELPPTDLEQVLVNLVINANHAMPDGGTVVVSAGARDGGLSLTVTDEGVGMTPEVRERAFEPFFTTRATGEGTGLGLATVYALVTGNGGRIRVESEPGRGSTFATWWPATERSSRSTSSPSPRRLAARRSETVLVVEDEPLVRRTARRMLSRRGVEVLEATNGAEALDVLQEHGGRIDLVVSDVVMPGVGGLELLAQTRELGLWMPFVLVSGYHQEGFDVDALRTRLAVFLDKPYDRSALLDSMDRARSLMAAAAS